jgi:hypothetical protein
MKNKMKYIVIALLILGVCSVGAYANVYWYNISPCDAIDISLQDARVITFLDTTNMATPTVYQCDYNGHNTWLVYWYTKTQSQRVYIDIYSGEIIGTNPEPEPCWHTVTTVQGRHDKKTPLFDIKGDTWRINWETVGHKNDSQISVTVYKDFGTFDYEYVDVFHGNNCPFTDTRDEYDGAGIYYLCIEADNLEYWSIEIEDFY